MLSVSGEHEMTKNSGLLQLAPDILLALDLQCVRMTPEINGPTNPANLTAY